MKNMYKNIFTVMIIVSAVIISGCEQAEPDYAYSFEVVSTYDGFFGYYKIDNNKSVEFTSSPMGTTGKLFNFEKNLDSPTSILVSATGDSPDTSSITIYIYEDSELVETEIAYPTVSGGIATATIDYTFTASSSK